MATPEEQVQQDGVPVDPNAGQRQDTIDETAKGTPQAGAMVDGKKEEVQALQDQQAAAQQTAEGVNADLAAENKAEQDGPQQDASNSGPKPTDGSMMDKMLKGLQQKKAGGKELDPGEEMQEFMMKICMAIQKKIGIGGEDGLDAKIKQGLSDWWKGAQKGDDKVSLDDALDPTKGDTPAPGLQTPEDNADTQAGLDAADGVNEVLGDDDAVPKPDGVEDLEAGLQQGGPGQQNG